MSTWELVLIVVAISIISVVAIALILRSIFREKYEKSVIDYQNKLLSQEMKEVQNIYMTMRGWRHDYHNHMQSIKAYLAKDNIEEARAYLDNLETELDDIKLLFDTGNLNVDAILNAKISLALDNNISCDYKAVIPKNMDISDIDLCVIIGNLIDNAVESCRNVTPERQFIRLYIGPLKKQLYISVTNATNEVVRKMDDEYISAKRGDHGHGLKSINNAVEKNNGYINRKNEPGVFVTEIMLPICTSCTN